MFEIICNGKKRTTSVWSTAVKNARWMSMDEFDTAYVFSEQDPSNPFAEFVCGQRADEEDSKTLKIGK